MARDVADVSLVTGTRSPSRSPPPHPPPPPALFSAPAPTPALRMTAGLAAAPPI